MTTDVTFWNKAAEKYALSKISDMESYERKLAETRAFLTPDSRVLEIGCGTGTTALHHAPHAGHIVATDLSDEMIRIARDKARAQGAENIEFRVQGVDEVTVAPGSFDMVMAHSILHLVPDLDRAIRLAFDALAPGGVFISSTTCLGGLRWLPIRAILPLMRVIGKAPEVTAFTTDQLQARIRAAGFAIERTWQPKPTAALFVVARKPGQGASLAAG